MLVSGKFLCVVAGVVIPAYFFSDVVRTIFLNLSIAIECGTG